MEVSPLAGKPADPSILIDVEKLVAAEFRGRFSIAGSQVELRLSSGGARAKARAE